MKSNDKTAQSRCAATKDEDLGGKEGCKKQKRLENAFGIRRWGKKGSRTTGG